MKDDSDIVARGPLRNSDDRSRQPVANAHNARVGGGPASPRHLPRTTSDLGAWLEDQPVPINVQAKAGAPVAPNREGTEQAGATPAPSRSLATTPSPTAAAPSIDAVFGRKRVAAPGEPALRSRPSQPHTGEAGDRSSALSVADPAAHEAGASEAAAPAPVQLRAAGPSTTDVHTAASRAIATPAQQLPHRDKIEAAVGRDLSHIKAHVGGDAEVAARGAGAEALASGDHVVLPANPSLTLTTHEVAHTFQQAAGVQLKDGVGQAGDTYERQADAAAELVASGQSAAHLFHSGPRSATPVVQLSPGAPARQADAPLSGRANTPGTTYEFETKAHDGEHWEFTAIKISISKKDSKAVTGEAGQSGSASADWSFLENKVTREQAASRWAWKLGTSLAQLNGQIEIVDGLRFKATAELFDAEFDPSSGDAGLDVAKLTFAFEGTPATLLDYFIDVPAAAKDRLEINVSGEFALKVPAIDLVRLVQMRRAAGDMTRHSKQLAKSTEELKQLAGKRGPLEEVTKQQWGKRTRAKWKGDKKAWQAMKAAARQELAENKRLSKQLTEEIATSKAGLKTAQRLWHSGRNGLKTAIGKSVAVGLEKATKKALQKVLGKLIPGLNLVSTAIDIYEVITLVWNWANGAEIELGVGEDGDSEGSEGSEGKHADAGDGGDHADGGTADSGQARDRDGGDHAEGGDHGGHADGGTAGSGKAHNGDGAERADGGSERADGGTGDEVHDGDAGEHADGGTGEGDAGTDEDPVRQMPTLHAGAQAVLDLLRSDQGVAFSANDLENLNAMIPADLSGEEVAELKRRLAAGTLQLTDPFEIIGTVHEQINRIRNGYPRPQITVDGVDTTDAVLGAGSSTEQRTEPPAGDSTGAKTMAAPEEMLPETVMLGAAHFDPATTRWVILPAWKTAIAAQPYIHADGTEVRISNAKITNKQVNGKQKLYMATFNCTATVVAIPGNIGAGYPFKVGQTKEYSLKVWHSGTHSGTVEQANPFLAALTLEDGRWTANPGDTVHISDAILVARQVIAQDRTRAGWNVSVACHVQTAAEYSTVVIAGKAIPLVAGQDVVIGPVTIPDADDAGGE